MNLLFPMAFGANFYATTGLMVYLSIVGKSDLAADVGIVQASTSALFYAFSGNARSLILNKRSLISSDNLLAIRYLLILPLSIVSLFLSIYISSVAWVFAVLLILRRGGEWLNDIYLSERENNKNYHHLKYYILLQCITLLIVFISIHISNDCFYAALLLWSIIPLLSSTKYLLKKTSVGLFNNINPAKLLPHLGSTAAIGIGVYVFRLVILSLVDKPVAGDLFSAFAIGGFIGSIFAHTIGPSFINNSLTYKSSLFKYFHLFNTIYVFIGIVLIGISWNKYDALLFLSKNGLFFGAIGFSLVGGVVMIYAQLTRLKIIQKFEDSDVYGPDVLINIIFIASVPFLFYIFGLEILPGLFLVSATINYIFYRFYHIRINKNLESIIPIISSAILKCIVSGLIFIPLFFQINSGIFNNKSLVFDTEGLLFNLPIPVSVLACMFGFVVFNDYKKSRTTMTAVLLLFVLMVISTVVTTKVESNYQQAKMILMMQFIMPSLALILGQLIYKDITDLKLIAKSFLYIVLILVPSHLLITWLNGVSTLVSYLYLFSFYQHLQYGGVIVISAYIFSLFILNEDVKYRMHLFVLMPLVGLYAVASASRLSVALYLFSIVIFSCYQWKTEIKKKAIISFTISVICIGGYMGYQLNNSPLHQQKFYGTNTEILQQSKRSFYWKYYLNGVIDNKKATLFGHSQRPDRKTYPSAHNYYLDLVYHFGIIALFPIAYLILYTIYLIVKNRQYMLSDSSLLGICIIVLFLIIIDNFFKVGFRQPYPGIYSFFIWGLLIGILNNIKNHRHSVINDNGR